MDNRLIDNVTNEVSAELYRGMKDYGHPLFNSAHEGYAVILEEVEEAQYEIEFISKAIANMWTDIKANSDIDPLHLELIKLKAIMAACEAIQVAAMAEKFKQSIDKNK